MAETAIELPPTFFKIFSQPQVAEKILAGHDRQRLINISLLLGKKMGMDPAVVIPCILLHDTGKMFIPSEILFKNGPLTPEERRVMEKHAALGAAFLSNLGFSWEIIKAVLSHHEDWDGSGYPRGLVGEEIPQLACLIRVADSIDAMLFQRPYQPPKSLQKAYAELIEGSGTKYDPAVIELLPTILPIH